MKKYQLLSGAALKYIAMFSMLIDHFNKAVMFPLSVEDSPQWVYIIEDVFTAVGRFAFPIFCFLLVEGFYHTKSKAKYLIGMLVFAVISEVPFDMNVTQRFWEPASQNIFFSLAIAVATIWATDEVRKKTKVWPLFAVIFTIVGAVSASLLGADYGFYGVLVPMAFYLFRFNRILASVVGYLCIFKSFWAIPAFVLINLYNGERGKQNKWVNYWFYPVHLLVLGIVTMYVIGV